jgi:hypothetical protein
VVLLMIDEDSRYLPRKVPSKKPISMTHGHVSISDAQLLERPSSELCSRWHKHNVQDMSASNGSRNVDILLGVPHERPST